MLIYGLNGKTNFTKFNELGDGEIFYLYSSVTSNGIESLFMKIYDAHEKNAVNLVNGYTLIVKSDTPVVRVKAHIVVD